MARSSAVFDGTELNNEATRRYLIESTPDFGSQGVADALLTGQYRLEEYDAVAQSMNLTRTVSLPLRLTGETPDLLVTRQQALTGSIAGASRFNPKTFTWTPSGSSHVSTFRVFGGSWAPRYDGVSEHSGILFGDLSLTCDWPIRGPVQNLGSSGSPLTTNTASPALVTLSPSPVGDIPGDVILYVKNRAASAIRSMIVSGISLNTTWVAHVNAGTGNWTLDAQGSNASGVTTGLGGTQDIVYGVAHFAAPTLPSDRRFRVYLRAGQDLPDGGSSFRIRLVSGATEIIGPWRTLPPETDTPGTGTINIYDAVDMGSYTFPVGSVGSLGAQSTTVYVEQVQHYPNLHGGDSLAFKEALFLPDDSTLVVETSDTGKTLAAASGIIQVESDQPYDSSGNPAGGAVIGANIRTLGGRYYVYTSQGYMGSLDSTIPWSPESVDVWASYTPRYIGIA